jgi:D-3-phosphoglycerate dehydrogenase
MATTTASAAPAAPKREGGAALTLLIADKFEQSGIDAARALGCRVELRPGLSPQALTDAVRELNPHALIVRSTKVPAATFDAGERLAIVIRAGAGYDNIDVAAASDHGVFVANCPGKNSLAVAELAWGLILACDRRIPDQTIDLRRGAWDKKQYSKARGLAGRTLGIIGLGQIGEAVAVRGRAFGMKVVAWSRSLTAARAEALDVVYCATPIDVARQADVVTVHVAKAPETRSLVNAEFLAAMRPGACFVNTSRGEVVDEAALLKAVREKGLRVGLDVFANEPGADDKTFASEIAREPGVCGTHHIGASTDQAQEAIAAETVRLLESYVRRGVVPNCVNRVQTTPARYLLTVRHLNRAGVLAHVFRVLGEARINVEEMENVIYEGARAACARIQLDDQPTPGQLAAIRNGENVLGVDLMPV